MWAIVSSFPAFVDRAHVALRILTCPWPQIIESISPGAVLDIGCGHGLLAMLLTTRDPTSTVVGVDIDVGKLRSATRAAARLGLDHRIDFLVLGDNLPPGPFDTITFTDMLYLLTVQEWRALLSQSARRLAPDGRIVIKAMADTPGWKARWDAVQEQVATKVARYTLGSVAARSDVATVRTYLGRLGFHSETQRIDRGYPHPHTLITAQRPR